MFLPAVVSFSEALFLDPAIRNNHDLKNASESMFSRMQGRISQVENIILGNREKYLLIMILITYTNQKRNQAFKHKSNLFIHSYSGFSSEHINLSPFPFIYTSKWTQTIARHCAGL
jgi:hypothetical protein